MTAAVKPARAARRVVAERGGGERNAAADARAAITRCTECRIITYIGVANAEKKLLRGRNRRTRATAG
jgi:hypothetical protein